MFRSSFETAAREALRSFFHLLPSASLLPLGNHGGFSGAQLFRVVDSGMPFCLRAWPAAVTAERLTLIHALMQEAFESGLEYVPQLYLTRHGSWVEQAGRLWELTTWMPGQADFHQRPSGPRLEAACQALARIHVVWAAHRRSLAPCPGIQRRLRRVAEWNELRRDGWTLRSAPEEDPSLKHWSERAWRAVERRIETVAGLLAPWQNRPLPLHPCLCDVWHDHVLFEREVVTGLIDYGAIKTDHVSVDLARLLGSLVGDDTAMWELGLSAYGQVRRLGPEEVALSRILDETGTLLGATTWLLWLYRDRKTFADRSAVARHLRSIVERIERWE